MEDNQQVDESANNAVDDQGTSEAEGRALIKKLRDAGFDGSNEKLATALGRSADDIEGWTAGTEPVDDDVIMKVRGIASERGIEIE